VRLSEEAWVPLELLGEEKVQDVKTQVLANQESSKEELDKEWVE
jgi:hypothetical protein